MEQAAGIMAKLGFLPREAIAEHRTPGTPIRMDIRPRADGKPVEAPPMMPTVPVECFVRDARASSEDFSLDTSGFGLFNRPSAVADWRDNDEVMRVYYEECRQLARDLTGAQHVFTYDHILRDAGVQVYGGGLGEPAELKSERPRDAYVSQVHLDYTDHSTFGEYLALHGVREPEGASRVVMLNFWRPLYAPVERDPLAVCDARTIREEDVLEINMLGFLPKNYSWHDIGMNLAWFAHSPEQQWYYFSKMTPDEVLVMQTYDSRGVIGRSSGHGAFPMPGVSPDAPPRRSVELRVLCYLDAH